MPRLHIFPDGGDPYVFSLPPSRIIIGRSPSSDLPLGDKCCSSRHAAVFPTAGGFAIQDLESKNGTSVNSEFIRQKTDIRIGDIIRIGSTVLRLEADPSQGERGETDTTADRSGTVVKKVTEFLLTTPPPIIAASGRPPGLPLTAEEREDASIIEAVNETLIYTDGQLDKYLDRIMDAIIRHIPMDRGVLMLGDEGTGRLESRVTRLHSPVVNAGTLPISQSIVRMAFEKNQAVLIPDTQKRLPFRDAESIIKAHIHSAMCAPLFDSRSIIGVVYADRISRNDPFDETDLRRFIFLANQAADKIQLDRRHRAKKEIESFQIELNQARKFLHNLLPRADPDFGPFDISGRAETSPTVGGDYYDYIPFASSKLGLVIADVAGTGLGASLQMTWLSSALRAGSGTIQDLGALAAWLSEGVFKRTEPEEFISFFMGVLDRDSGRMTYVNAGHNYPLLLNPAGEVRQLTSTGLCLGMFSGSCYETRTVAVEPGQVLCLYTDGIIEHRNSAREPFGEARLLETLRGSSGLPARDVVGRVYEAVRSFSPGSVPDDDMTMVILKRRPG